MIYAHLIGGFTLFSAVTAATMGDSNRTDRVEQPVSSIRAELAPLQEAVARLGGTADPSRVLDELYFGWFDRPYARATMAVMVKTTMVLEGEAERRDRRRPRLSDQDVAYLLEWLRDAVRRAPTMPATPDFMPHRICPSDLGWWTGQFDRPLIAVLDEATETAASGAYGDLDLIAALGVRVCARRAPAKADSPPPGDSPILRRADALGLSVVQVESSAEPMRSGDPPTSASSTPRMRSTPRLRPVTLLDVLSGRATVSRSADSGEVRLALRDPAGGESPAAAIARRSLARSISNDGRFIVHGFQPLRAADGRSASEMIPASMWIAAAEGMSLGTITGWRDSDSVAAPSLFHSPARLEAMAHAALDLLRLGDCVSALSSAPPLAVVIGPDAVDPADSNRWAQWTAPLWAGLVKRQLPFDVVRRDRLERGDAQYKHVLDVAMIDGGDLASLLTRLDYRIALDRTLRGRPTLRTLEGWLARRVWLRTGVDDHGAWTIALANLTGEAKTLRLRGNTPADPMLDVLSGATIPAPREAISMNPWQIRILRAVPTSP